MEGGENIKPANWLSVSNIIQLVSLREPFVSVSMSVHTQRHRGPDMWRHTDTQVHAQEHAPSPRGFAPG